MSILSAPIYNILIADSTLTDLLSLYQGEIPAIFTTDPTPGDAVLPYIVIPDAFAQVPADSKTCRGREINQDIRCYTAQTGAESLVDEIAERVRYLLHRESLTVSGFTWVLSDITGPIAANEADTYGRVLSLRCMVYEV